MARSRPGPDLNEPVSDFVHLPDLIRGNVDRISQDGLLFGWCLNETFPADRPEVTIRVDGVAVGRALASSFRQDLMDAGVGDGRHGFAFPLPISAIRQQRSCFVTVQHTKTGTELGPGVTYRNDRMVGFDDRLDQIENDLLLIRERMEVTASGDASIAMLFDAVGTFFVRLGQDLREGRATPEGMGLAGRVDAIAASYADIKLPFPAAPRFAIFLVANQSLDVLHSLLLEIAGAALLHEADVFLLDNDIDVNVALLPTLVRNLRYIRLDGSLLETIAAMTKVVQHEFLLFVDGAAGLYPHRLDDLAAAIKADRLAGIVGTPLMAEDWPATGWNNLEALSFSAVDASLVALSAKALADIGGLDTAYESLDVAIADACLRLRQTKWKVEQTVPLAPPAPASLRTRTPAQELARNRSLVLLQQKWPDQAIIVGDRS